MGTFRFLMAFILCCGLYPIAAPAQIGGFEGHEKRVVGAEPPVIEAVLDQDIDALQRLWQKDRLRYQDRGRQGRTALIAAAMIGDREILDYLMTKNALLEASDDYGNTALHYGATQGYENVVATLIAAGADIDATNNNGEVALFMATRQGHWDVIQQLLDDGADSGITDYTARGLMDYAALAKDRRIARKLQKYLY